jgi:hypothetical protein
MATHPEAKIPTEAEVDSIVGAAHFDGECSVLCNDLLDAIDQLGTTTGIVHSRLVARIRALRARMKELRCGLCLPQ